MNAPGVISEGLRMALSVEETALAEAGASEKKRSWSDPLVQDLGD